MNSNPLLGQVLGNVFGGGGGLGGMLGGLLGNQPAQPGAAPANASPASNHGTLLVMLMPLVMRWVQRSGGMGAVLDRFRQHGLGAQAQSWVSSGTNQPVDAPTVQRVVGDDEVRQMAQRLGVPEQQVSQALAEVLPHLVDQLTPQGHVPQQADDLLEQGARRLEQELQGARQHASAAS